ncbi:MAG: class I SAM-dependent methyltransferase [Candidatus Parcubacteria bacterium]|nr:class I SAM-dependent methyltransferase [Burkholderiales bacterium]
MLRSLILVLAMGWLPAAEAQQGSLPPQIGQVSKDSVWVPTPERLIRRLLQLADVTSSDVVVDLGSGDGRIPIHAAKHFGARGIGVELEDNLLKLSTETAQAAGVAGLVRFVKQDLFEFDLSVASVVTLYISPGVMIKLKPRLLGLKPGTRVVSHHFTLEDWEPDEEVKVEGRSGYLWVVPADLRGRWSVAVPGEALRLQIAQNGKQLAVRAEREGRPVVVVGAKLRGTDVQFTAFDRDGSSRTYRGRLEAGRLSGESDGHGIRALAWSAVRE